MHYKMKIKKDLRIMLKVLRIMFFSFPKKNIFRIEENFFEIPWWYDIIIFIVLTGMLIPFIGISGVIVDEMHQVDSLSLAIGYFFLIYFVLCTLLAYFAPLKQITEQQAKKREKYYKVIGNSMVLIVIVAVCYIAITE